MAWRLAEAQRAGGHDARLLVGYKNSNSEYAAEFDLAPDSVIWENFSSSGQLYYEFQGSHKLLQHRWVMAADIVHLHNLHGGYFNPYSLVALSKAKPLVWTLHDMQAITGHCAHAFECRRWQTGCGLCPHLDTEPALPVDATAQLWDDKRTIYQQSILNIVAPSQWLKNILDRSILKNQHIEVIYNGINTGIFRPYPKAEARARFGLPLDAFITGSVAHGGALSNQWKGSGELQCILDTLWQKYPSMLFLNIGGSAGTGTANFINTGHVNDENILALLYSCLDIFIYTSAADNCPLVILEALGCGVPVVSFEVGGVPELVRSGIDGFVIGERNILSMVNAVEQLHRNRMQADGFSLAARERVLACFDHDLITDKYEKNYQQVIERHSQTAGLGFGRGTSLKSLAISLSSEPPRITIVTPSYNQAEYLEECIDSILSQNYPNLEYIIMDGGSTDGSVDIIKRYAQYLTYWQSRPDGGQYAAINEGFQRSTGEIMTWLNSDDKFHPEAFDKVASIFFKHEDVKWVMGRPNGFDVDGLQSWVLDYLPLWSREKYLKKQYHNPYIQQEGTFWRRSLWEAAGGYVNCDLKMAGDLELWIRFFRHAQLYSVDALLAGYRSQPLQKAALFLDQYNQEAEALLEEECRLFDQSVDKTLLPAPLPILIEHHIKDETHILVSAIVSTYNSERFMRGCLEDLTAQTLFEQGCLEIVVVDSASPQNEGAIVREFKEQFGDRIVYIRTDERETIYQAWNRGIKASRGKYITNANTDDRHRGDALEVMAAKLEANLDVALVYGDCFVTCLPNQTFEHHVRCGYHMRPDYQPEIMLSGCHMGPQPMWRKSVHDEIGYFSEQYGSAGDYEFWCRVAAKYRLMHIPKFLGLYYENPRGFANSDARLSVQETISIQQFYADRFPPPARDYSMNYQYQGVVSSNSHVNICMVTCNNLPGLTEVIKSLVRNTDYPHMINVADMGSSDGTRDFLLGLKKDGLLTNLLLLDGNITIAEVFAQLERCGPEAGFQLVFGNSIVADMPGWLSAFVMEAQNCPAPFMTNRIWSRDRAIKSPAGMLPAYVLDDNMETSCCMKIAACPTRV